MWIGRPTTAHRIGEDLTWLDLGDTRVTDAGLKELAGLKQLTMLSLWGTPVTDAGLKELAGLQQLTTLYLFWTRVTDEGVAELQKALPKCRIHPLILPKTSTLSQSKGISVCKPSYLDSESKQP